MLFTVVIYFSISFTTSIKDLFVPFKTPLDSKFDNEMTPANRFNLENFLSSKKTEKVELIINLTKTERYYKSDQLNGIKLFSRISCEGHDGPPTLDQVKSFIIICQNFVKHNINKYIGVHCTHGFNRTGFMIVSYLVEEFDTELEVAVQLFANSRPPGIYKQDYLNELMKRYECEVELIAPEVPNWDDCEDDDNESLNNEQQELLEDSSNSSDSENSNSTQDSGHPKTKKITKPKRKMRKIFVAPKLAAFMEGVNKVSVVTDTAVIEEVQEKVRDLMGVTKYDFVGSQPVSMTLDNLKLLTKKKYMVSWKADGTRYIMLIADKDLVYMFDRDNCVYKVENINFPKNAAEHHTNTLLDGEMVIDTYQGQKFPRFLIYDIMNIGGEYVGNQLFTLRHKLIKTVIIDSRTNFVSPEMRKTESFGIRIKDFWPIEKTRDIWEGKFREQLCHEMDGLIYQPCGTDDVYLPGTCDQILKWKPPSLNSIDFKLKCEYIKKPDLVPFYVGYLYVSGEKSHFGAIEKIRKQDRDKYDGKIVECTLDKDSLQWLIMRERTDKSKPNHISTAYSVLDSIKHPVTINHVYQAINYAINRDRPIFQM